MPYIELNEDEAPGTVPTAIRTSNIARVYAKGEICHLYLADRKNGEPLPAYVPYNDLMDRIAEAES